MSGLKFDKTFTLGDVVKIAVVIVSVVAFAESLKFRLDDSDRQQADDEKKITLLFQDQKEFQQSLEDEKEARMAYQGDNDKTITAIQTFVDDRLNIKQ